MYLWQFFCTDVEWQLRKSFIKKWECPVLITWIMTGQKGMNGDGQPKAVGLIILVTWRWLSHPSSPLTHTTLCYSSSSIWLLSNIPTNIITNTHLFCCVIHLQNTLQSTMGYSIKAVNLFIDLVDLKLIKARFVSYNNRQPPPICLPDIIARDWISHLCFCILQVIKFGSGKGLGMKL